MQKETEFSAKFSKILIVFKHIEFLYLSFLKYGSKLKSKLMLILSVQNQSFILYPKKCFSYIHFKKQGCHFMVVEHLLKLPSPEMMILPHTKQLTKMALL